MRKLWFVALAFVLAGCATQAGLEARAVLDRQIADCERQFGDSYARPATPTMKCSQKAKLAYNREANRFGQGASPDVVAAAQARMLLIYEEEHLFTKCLNLMCF